MIIFSRLMISVLMTVTKSITLVNLINLFCRYSPRDPSLSSETFHYEKGANQLFSQPSHVFDPSPFPDEDLAYNAEKEIVPVAIHCLAQEGLDGKSVRTNYFTAPKALRRRGYSDHLTQPTEAECIFPFKSPCRVFGHQGAEALLNFSSGIKTCKWTLIWSSPWRSQPKSHRPNVNKALILTSVVLVFDNFQKKCNWRTPIWWTLDLYSSPLRACIVVLLFSCDGNHLFFWHEETGRAQETDPILIRKFLNLMLNNLVATMIKIVKRRTMRVLKHS